MNRPFGAGFRTVEAEQSLLEVPVQGRLPEWLEGSLLRNGPGRWRAGLEPIGHWFDGFSLLHLFRIAAGRVEYASRFLVTPDKTEAEESGRISRPGFACDPCRGLFQKVMSLFVPEFGANANVNLVRWGKRFLALTETPMAVEFDPQTLATLGLHDYAKDELSRHITSAHPIAEAEHLYNFTVKMGRTSHYVGYRLGSDGRREVFSRHPSHPPAYLHSCGLTDREMILFEGPLVVEPLRLLWRDRPYIECYRWRPQLGSKLALLPRNGEASRSLSGPAHFVFHQVNQFYRGGTLCVDALAYPDPSVIDALRLDCLEGGRVVPTPVLMRFLCGKEEFTAETLCSIPLELPRIAAGCQGCDYRYVYGVTRRTQAFYDAVAKVDVRTGSTQVWWEDDCFPGEPVLVASPAGGGEDDGVVLSVVLDGKSSRSFLLVLDARSFQELARAQLPCAVPFGFHGAFFARSSEPE